MGESRECYEDGRRQLTTTITTERYQEGTSLSCTSPTTTTPLTYRASHLETSHFHPHIVIAAENFSRKKKSETNKHDKDVGTFLVGGCVKSL